MIIGIDASRYAHNEATGVEWYSWHIINNLIEESLKNEEDRVILYSPNYLKLDNKIAELMKKHKDRIQTKVLPARRLWTLLKLSREMKRNPPDVLFVPSHVLPLKLPKKSVIMIHDVAFKYLKKSYSWFAYKYLDWSTGFAVKNATKIIVPSEATKEDLIRFYKCSSEKITVIQHGFSSPEIKKDKIDKIFGKSSIFKYFGIKKDSPIILFVGRLENKKNLIRLVEAFKAFLKKYPEYRLILAGKRGIGFDQLLKVVKHLKLIDKVIMPGYVTEGEKACLYKYCNVFAFPSLYEGFGLPILEAFYYKIPVLTSHVSCLPEVAGDAAYYADPYDVEVITSGLERLVTNEKYAEKLISLGKERLKKFSWNSAAKKTLSIITK
ncbi:MAG: glycosyltransferase [Candidatus Moranbacteria bacterium]|nr:glycosyltransferase [Candidatus Moranbacteria bacterium]